LPLLFEVNGTFYQFPFTASGAIVGPNSTTVGDVAMWNNTTGTLLKDSPVTGTGSVVLANNPVLTLPNATGLPISAGVSGLGSGVAVALGVNIGLAGAPVLFNGAGGTPTSLTLTNATGLPNAGLINPSLTLGSTSIALGATATTIAGLTSVTSTTFVGSLTGAASLNLPLTGGALSGALTYGGVTLANSVTGTGSMVLSVSPTFTGQPVIPGLPNLTANVETTGVPGLDNSAAGWMIYTAPTSPTVNNPVDTLRFQRNANYTGGTSTNVFAGLHGYCYAQANVTNLEWCGVFQMENFSSSAQNVALFAQNYREPGAGLTWGLISNAQDVSGSANPTNGLISYENDILADGTDTNQKRFNIDMVLNSNLTPNTGIVHAYAGIWFTPGNSNPNAVWDNLVTGLGNAGNGIVLAGITFTGEAIALGTSQKLAMDCGSSGTPVVLTCARYLSFFGGQLTYHTASGAVFDISDAGAIAFGGGSAIVSSGPGGTLGNPAFVASSVTKTCGATIVVTNGVVTSC
jgi:hypothetical protein